MTLVVSGGISVVQFLACLPSIVLIDRLGTFFLAILFFLVGFNNVVFFDD